MSVCLGAEAAIQLGLVRIGWLTDKELALRMLQWIMAFAVAGRDQLRHTHVNPAPPCLLTALCSLQQCSTHSMVADRIWG